MAQVATQGAEECGTGYVSLEQRLKQVAEGLREGTTIAFSTLVDDYFKGKVPYFAGSDLVVLAETYAQRKLGRQVDAQSGSRFIPQQEISNEVLDGLAHELTRIILHRETTVSYGLSKGNSVYATRVLQSSAFDEIRAAREINMPNLQQRYDTQHNDRSYYKLMNLDN